MDKEPKIPVKPSEKSNHTGKAIVKKAVKTMNYSKEAVEKVRKMRSQ